MSFSTTVKSSRAVKPTDIVSLRRCCMRLPAEPFQVRTSYIGMIRPLEPEVGGGYGGNVHGVLHGFSALPSAWRFPVSVTIVSPASNLPSIR